MFIQTEDTPNPDTVKFLPGVKVIEGRTADFTSKDAAGASPLAQKLFDIKGVKRVFFGDDFISVTKDPKKEWFVLKPQILSAILDASMMGIAFWDAAQEKLSPQTDTSNANDSDVVKQIKELIETRVRPAVAQDGGDIVFHNFDDGVVYLEMRGACAGCPSSSATLKSGIENMLTYYVPEVREVRAVEY